MPSSSFSSEMSIIASLLPPSERNAVSAPSWKIFAFTFSPTFGVRARVSRALALQFEARDHTIRYEWPLRYFDPIDANGNAITPPVLGPGKKTQLTHNFSLTAGLSYNFTF